MNRVHNARLAGEIARAAVARSTPGGRCETIGAVQWKQVVRLGRELPEAVEGIWFRTPSLEVRGKSFARLKEDGENIVFLLESVDEQEALCEAMGDIYWITDHYRGYAAVMARLATLTEAECRVRLERAWRVKAPKKLLTQLAGGPATAETAKTAKAKTAAAKTAAAKTAKTAKTAKAAKTAAAKTAKTATKTAKSRRTARQPRT